MSNRTLQKDVEKGRKSSVSNHVGAKCSGVNRLSRSRVPLARKCCACQANDSCKTDQKTPQKSLGDANKVTNTGTDLTTVSRKTTSTQVKKNDCGNKSEATTPVSACTSPAGRHKGKNVAKKKAIGEEKRERVSQQTTPIKTAAKSPKQTEAKAAIDGHKHSTKDSESNGLAGSSKQSTKKNYPSPSVSKLKKSAVSNQSLKKEPKERSSTKKEVPREKAETKASSGKLKLSSDIQSANSVSDWSSDSSYFEHHVTWDGLQEEYRIGENCCLCDMDVGVWPLEDDGQESEFSNLPVVSILPCGHVFHHYCLEIAEFGVQEGDYPVPLCVFCESITS